MEYEYEVGDSIIKELELNKTVEEIILLLKKEKRTYGINKFILQRVIQELDESIVD